MKDEEKIALDDLRSIGLLYNDLICHNYNAVDLERKANYNIKIDNEYETIRSALVEKDKLEKENEELKAKNEELIRISDHAYEKQKLAEQENKRLKARLNSVFGSMCADGKSTETLKCSMPHFIKIGLNVININNINHYYVGYIGDCSLCISFGKDDEILLKAKDENELKGWLKLLGEE